MKLQSIFNSNFIFQMQTRHYKLQIERIIPREIKIGWKHGEGNGHPLQCSCLENSTERRLVGYSPRVAELEMTERLTLSHSGRNFQLQVTLGELPRFAVLCVKIKTII